MVLENATGETENRLSKTLLIVWGGMRGICDTMGH